MGRMKDLYYDEHYSDEANDDYVFGDDREVIFDDFEGYENE